MELEVVQDAVHTLEARGVPLADITSVMIREITLGNRPLITLAPPPRRQSGDCRVARRVSGCLRRAPPPSHRSPA
jgi:hypothetical protein